MSQGANKLTASEVINKDKWWDTLSRFIDVLRINIFLIDDKGKVILPPESSKFGGRFFTDPVLSLGILQDSLTVLNQFERQGKYGEWQSPLDWNLFLIPIEIKDAGIIAYMVVGPVILNKRPEAREFVFIAEGSGIEDVGLFVDAYNEIRVVSNLMINSILDLLAEIVRDSVELSMKEKELERILQASKEIEGRKGGHQADEMAKVTKEIYSTIHQDELLGTLLDLALKMTGTECGSIMMLDEESDRFTIKVSRGMDEGQVKKVRVKLGEGVAGLAAQENEMFMIEGQTGDNRILKYLKRPEIKQALVLPLATEKGVLGVLNLHTTKEACSLKENLDNLQYLSRLLSSAI